jgi:hypothetical protein
MRAYSLDEIRQCFSLSTDFNEIFDVFQYAVSQKLNDVELYRILFWNHSLTADEVRLFGEKLAGEFPDLAYDFYIWMASVFEVTYASSDNFELALEYYQKASSVMPAEPDPYLDASDCYDPDLNIPPLPVLIEFVKRGLQHVPAPVNLYRRLAALYEYAGDAQQSEYYKQKADDASQSSGQQPPA